MTVVNPIDGAVATKIERRFKPKIGESLIPPKRKLVKKLIWDFMVQAITKPSHSSEFTCNNKKKTMEKKKRIFPA
ncbi:hypothetical protein HYC85_020032 [Camellia sinensis]|uniref:Uncharacterized protein n=1 Tax=Camellia sinensis TaxID=4442 RepID=A0A7J7GNX3_CAMSI|nr:hypothetical protein HYC85_020032 [Camellia sinensis]